MTKQRRPIGHKVEPDGPEPDTTVAAFLYREDAAEAAARIVGYVTHVQYLGVWMRWTVVARRKTWNSAREVFLQKDGTLAGWNWAR